MIFSHTFVTVADVSIDIVADTAVDDDDVVVVVGISNARNLSSTRCDASVLNYIVLTHCLEFIIKTTKDTSDRSNSNTQRSDK